MLFFYLGRTSSQSNLGFWLCLYTEWSVNDTRARAHAPRQLATRNARKSGIQADETLKRQAPVLCLEGKQRPRKLSQVVPSLPPGAPTAGAIVAASPASCLYCKHACDWPISCAPSSRACRRERPATRSTFTWRLPTALAQMLLPDCLSPGVASCQLQCVREPRQPLSFHHTPSTSHSCFGLNCCVRPCPPLAHSLASLSSRSASVPAGL
jgi:hypothetical protein